MIPLHFPILLSTYHTLLLPISYALCIPDILICLQYFTMTLLLRILSPCQILEKWHDYNYIRPANKL